MTVEFTLALAVMAISPLLLRFRLGKSWASRPFGLFVLAAIVYHGAAEVLLRATGVSEGGSRPPLNFTDRAALLAGVALLVMTIGYLATHPPGQMGELDRVSLGKTIDWRFTGLLTLPLLLATTHGQGYINGTVLNGQGVSSAGVAGQFMLPMLVLTAFGFVLRHPDRLLVALGAQSLVMAMAGQRLEILITALVLLVMVRRVGVIPSRPQVMAGAAVGLILMVGITSTRAQEGREVFYGNTGTAARVMSIGQGVLHPSLSGVHGSGPVVDAAFRLEANSWAGWINKAFSEGASPIGVAPVVISVVATVPSVLFPSKISALSLEQGSPAQWTQDALGIPPVNFLPGDLMFYYGALGLPWLLVFLFAVGAILGSVELQVVRSSSAVGVLGLLSLVESALFFEKGLPEYLLNARAFLVIGAGLWLLAKLREPRLSHREKESQRYAQRVKSARR